MTLSNVNADSTAVGSASVATSQNPLTKATLSFSPDELRLAPQYRWPVGTISVDRTELTDRIRGRKNNGMDTNQAWATEINHALHHGYRGLIAAKATRDFKARQLQTFFVGYNLAYESVTLAITEETSNAIGASAMIGLTWLLIQGTEVIKNKKRYGDVFADRWRASIMPGGPQFDRLILGGLASATTKFAKTIKPAAS